MTTTSDAPDDRLRTDIVSPPNSNSKLYRPVETTDTITSSFPQDTLDTSIQVRSNATAGTVHDSRKTSHSFCRCMIELLFSALRSHRRHQEDNMWERTVLLCIIVGVEEIKRTAVVLLDPQCPVDVVSTSCLRTKFPGFTYPRSIGETIGTSITAREKYQSIAMVDLRWYGQKGRARKSATEPQFRSRFEESSCHVVDSEEFELIIGRETIDRLRLYKLNHGIIAAFRGVASGVKVDNVARDQQTADAERDRARNVKKQREREKKDQQRLDKDKSKKK